MASRNSIGPPSPSASSTFLPLGLRSRRGSRASRTSYTQAEREQLNEALDQAHHAEYQSGTLTTFNEFTEPPSPTVVDNKGLVGDLQGGLSGLYSKFRASVGGMRDIVGSSKSGDSALLDTPSARSPKTASFASNLAGPGSGGSSEALPPELSTEQSSKAQSPTVETHTMSHDGARPSSKSKSFRLPSKTTSISSKSSMLSRDAVKSPLAPLTSIPTSVTADPAVTELNVNAALHHSRNNSGTLSISALQRADSPSLERKDSALVTSNSSLSHDPTVSRSSRSPELLAKPFKHKEGLEPGEAVRLPPPREPPAHERPSSPSKGPINNNRASLTELDTSFLPAHKRAKTVDGDFGSSLPRRESYQGDSIESLPVDNSPVKTSVTNSTSRLSTTESSNQDNRTPTTLDTSLTLTDKEPSSAHSSKASIMRQYDRTAPRVNQPRLPGFDLSRKTSSGTADSRSTAAVSHSTSNAQEHRSLDRLSRQHRTHTEGFKSRLLGREFWMRDENAKDCFYCGEPFTTFRRKHHCRTCGQIFDSKCTSLVPGVPFGHSGSVRLCRPCEAVIDAHEEDSTESSSDDMGPAMVNPRFSDSVSRNIGSRLPADDDDSSSIVSQSVDQVLKTPTLAIPATRRTGDGNNRRSAILEIGSSDRQLTRPTSSRSLRGSLNGRTHSVSHKRHHSKQQYIRSFKSYHDDRAPFQRRVADEMGGEHRLPAFHRDNIIDPDLAQYLSDDASSGDDQPNLFGVVSNGAISKSNGDSERSAFGGLLAAVKKGRPRGGDKSGSYGGRDGDDASISSSRAVNLPRSTRRRNLSVASSIHQRLSPRASKDNSSSMQLDHPIPPFSLTGASHTGGFKMTRSSSMRGTRAPPVELNRASLEHVRKLLRQLLQDASVPHTRSWETALMPIFLKATDDVDPDVQHGDDMDIRHYVKLKKIPGGHPGDTSYVSGLVFTKNVALKSMSRSIPRPKILIITFSLEYARQQQHFMSLEPVIRQEREFLENLVNRISAMRPNLLLVQKNVAGLALQLLEAASITTVYNVKPSVIEAVSRCTQTKIITSVDRLAASSAYPGQCGSFDVKTYLHKNRKKTYIYISGCPKELGCTIVLRGADHEVLVKVKRITEFMVYVVYNLKLETCLMRDEFAKIPTLPSETTNSSKTGLTNETASSETSGGKGTIANSDAVDGANGSDEVRPSQIAPTDSEKPALPNDLPTPTFYEDIVQKHQTKLLSASPFVKFEPPYLLMRARELEQQLAYLKRLRDQDLSKDISEDEKAKAQKFVLITPEMIHESLSGASAKVREVLHAVHDAEYDRALHNYQTQKRQWESYISGNSNLFDPYAHQNIVVLYSLVCTTTSIPCSGPDIFALGFYNEHDTDSMFEADCTLGQYVEDLCHSANAVCVNRCEQRMLDHHRQYVHDEAQVSVFVQPYPSKLGGMQDIILMWSSCKICGNETPPMPMSQSTWKYSFGKYLELSFDSAQLQARAGVCPHDLHRDHLRYFGFKDMALRIHYDPINLLEIVVPRPRVTWKVEKDLKLRNKIYTTAAERLNRFMTSIKSRLKEINVDTLMSEMAEACRKEIEALAKRADEEHETLMKQHQERYMDSKYWEIIPLSKLIHETQEKVVEWDAIFAEFERKYFPSEKDIKRMATLQLKKIFLNPDVSGVSLSTTDENAVTPIESDEAVSQRTDSPRLARRMTLSAQEAKNVLASVVEEERSGKTNKEKQQTETVPPVPSLPSVREQSESNAVENMIASQNEVQHLDLAISSDMAERVSSATSEPTVDSSIDTVAPESKAKPQAEGSSEAQQPRSPELFHDSFERRHTVDEITHPSARTSPPSPRPSGIPKLPDRTVRRGLTSTSPPLLRSHSQPAQLLKAGTGNGLKHEPSGSSTKPPQTDTGSPGDTKRKGEKRLSERLGLSSLKSSKLAVGHSLIPRSVKKSTRVSSLARHFEQLSREFEKERQRERQQRVARGKHSRAYPMASSNPIVQVYKNVKDAVEEREPSDESTLSSMASSKESTSLAYDMVKDSRSTKKSQVPPQKDLGQQDQRAQLEEKEKAEQVDEEGESKPRESEESQRDSSRGVSDGEDEDGLEEFPLAESPDETKMTPEDMQLDLKELPKDERKSLVKMLTSFWAERSASNWAALDYPLNDGEHVFADSNIIIREDEPSSLIAFALDSVDYKLKLANFQELQDDIAETGISWDGAPHDSQLDVEQSLLRHTGTHLKYQFQEGQAKMLCKVFYAEQFDALRRKCGVSERIVDSLSRCLKWDSKGGKTKSLFLKTSDERFILKSLSTIETQAFLKFAPSYFQIMSEALFHEMPSAIAKMFGFYQIVIKNPVTGVDFNWFLLLMENLFYDRSPTRIFDLKGSMRNRKVQSTGERDEVLLDENMVEYIYESPLFAREHSKKLLSQSVWNDTLFLGRQNVMDYSLMIAIDANRKELVVGIIDCIRTYTWDKKLESWIKDRGFAGGGKNRPTVTSPKEYKSRFREAMARYVLHAPK